MKQKCQPIIAMAVTLFLLAAPAVFAAETVVTSSGETVTLNLKDTSVKIALEALFRSVGRDFVLDPTIEGPVPALSFNDVPFDTALKSITKSAGLTFRIDDGVYMISKKAETARQADGPQAPVYAPEPVVETADEVTIEKIPLNYSSATDILALMNGDYENNNNGYGNGGFGSYGAGYGGSSGGFGGYGGGGYSGGYGGFGSMGGGGYSGGYGGSSGGYGGYGGYGGSGGGSYRTW